MLDLSKALNLQLFDGAAGAAAAGSGAQATGAKPQGAAAPATGENTQAAAATEQSTPAEKTYTEAELQTILKGRLKGAERNQQMLDSLAPALKVIGEKYGVDASDLGTLDAKALYDKITDDDSLYEAEAERLGWSIEAVKQLNKLKATNEQLRQQTHQDEMARQQEMKNRRVAEQAVQAKMQYPAFDLGAELQNPRFRGMLDSGVTVTDAYVALHWRELQSQTAGQVAQQAMQQASNAIQAGSRRPMENGSTGQQASVGFNPKTMTKEQRRDLRERVRRGERIVLPS